MERHTCYTGFGGDRKRVSCHCAGLLEGAVSQYTELLASLQPGACSGLYAWLLLKKAAALSQKREYDTALQSLNSALEWEPESVECLQLRAEVRRSHVAAVLGFLHIFDLTQP